METLQPIMPPARRTQPPRSPKSCTVIARRAGAQASVSRHYPSYHQGVQYRD